MYGIQAGSNVYHFGNISGFARESRRASRFLRTSSNRAFSVLSQKFVPRENGNRATSRSRRVWLCRLFGLEFAENVFTFHHVRIRRKPGIFRLVPPRCSPLLSSPLIFLGEEARSRTKRETSEVNNRLMLGIFKKTFENPEPQVLIKRRFSACLTSLSVWGLRKSHLTRWRIIFISVIIFVYILELGWLLEEWPCLNSSLKICPRDLDKFCFRRLLLTYCQRSIAFNNSNTIFQIYSFSRRFA